MAVVSTYGRRWHRPKPSGSVVAFPGHASPAPAPEEAPTTVLEEDAGITFSAFLAEFRRDFGGWSDTTWRGLSGVLHSARFAPVREVVLRYALSRYWVPIARHPCAAVCATSRGARRTTGGFSPANPPVS